MVGERGTDSEGQWQVENVRRLHKTEQSMSKRFIPVAEHWLLGGQHLKVSTTKIPGCILGVQSDSDAPQGWK